MGGCSRRIVPVGKTVILMACFWLSGTQNNGSTHRLLRNLTVFQAQIHSVG